MFKLRSAKNISILTVPDSPPSLESDISLAIFILDVKFSEYLLFQTYGTLGVGMA